jgi:hypothetical protein
MFYKGTKVIIIGSAVTRRAGPRVGSIGYILSVSDSLGHNEKGDIFYCTAKVLFTRYGYQDRERLEIKKVILVAPEVFHEQNTKDNIIQKLKRYVRTEKRNHIVAVPVNTCSEEDKAIVLFSKLMCDSHLIANLYNVYASKLDKSFYRPERLRKSLDYETLKLVYLVISTHRLFLLKGLIKACSQNSASFNSLFVLVNKLQTLHTKTCNLDSVHPPVFFYSNVKRNLFKTQYIVNLFTSRTKEKQVAEVEKICDILAAVFLEGAKTFNKFT